MVKVARCALYSFPATSCLNAILFFFSTKVFFKGLHTECLKEAGQHIVLSPPMARDQRAKCERELRSRIGMEWPLRVIDHLTDHIN